VKHPVTCFLEEKPTQRSLKTNKMMQMKYNYDQKLRLDKKYKHDPKYKARATPSNAYEQQAATKMAYVPGVHDVPNPAKSLVATGSSTPRTTSIKTTKRKPPPNCMKHIKPEFTPGSVVAVPAAVVDPEKYEGKPDSPTFLGVVKDPYAYDDSEDVRTEPDETLVEVVVAGEYAWTDKSKPNTILKPIKNGNLVTMRLPPDQLVNTRTSAEEYYQKWFVGIRSGWKIREFKRVCDGCGSPYCYYWKKSKELKAMMIQVGKMKFMTNCSKRYKCYSKAVPIVRDLVEIGAGKRFRLGYCFVESVRGAFPDPEYKGFRYSEFHSDDDTVEQL
jgi:hypothetical protein